MLQYVVCMVQPEEGATCTYKSLKIQHVANTTRCRNAGNTLVSISTTYVLVQHICVYVCVCVFDCAPHCVALVIKYFSAQFCRNDNLQGKCLRRQHRVPGPQQQLELKCKPCCRYLLGGEQGKQAGGRAWPGRTRVVRGTCDLHV